MIKHFCDRCKKEFTPQKRFVVGEIIEQSQSLLGIDQKKPMIVNAQRIRKFHLCPNCLEEFKKWLGETKQK